MARQIIPQALRSVEELKEQYGPLPRPHDWQLLQEQLVGEINGLPGSRGTAVATNGILVAIVQQQGIFIGHIDSFVVDQEATVKVLDVNKVKTTNKPKVEIEDFV